MAVEYKKPGVYVEEVSKLPPSVASVDTVPAFVGYTRIAKAAVDDDLINKPTRISSMLEYEQLFGGPQPEQGVTVTLNFTQDTAPGSPTLLQSAVASLASAARSKHIMYYAMQMYFANGGGPCFVVSVGKYSDDMSTSNTLTLTDFVDAADPTKGLGALTKELEPTLLVFPEAQGLSAIASFKTLHDAALQQCAEMQSRFVIMDVHGDAISLSDPDANPANNLLAAVGNFRSSGIGADNLKYGAAYAPNVQTVLPFAFDETKTVVHLVVNNSPTTSPMLDTLKTTDNRSYASAKQAIADLPNTLPPSAGIAGIYASVDNSRGIWKAPANVGMISVIQPALKVSDKDHGDINVDSVAGKSVNVIRSFLGRGTLVWGARTLAGNDNEWRYVSVRRLFIMVEQSVKNATAQFVFEANDANTWVKIQAMIENYLTTLWRQGALQGVKPEHAFYVSVGLGKTMSALDILEGRLIVEIGMAAVRPAEFIILRFSHKMAES